MLLHPHQLRLTWISPGLMIYNFYRNKSRKQSLYGQQVLKCSRIVGQRPPNQGPWSGSSGATCSHATQPALGEEPLANRWRQRSTADRPGAQRPTQAPGIQPRPAMGTGVRAQTRTPPHSSHHTPRPSQGHAPRASTEPSPVATAPAELRWRPGIILHFRIERRPPSAHPRSKGCTPASQKARKPLQTSGAPLTRAFPVCPQARVLSRAATVSQSPHAPGLVAGAAAGAPDAADCAASRR
ncbi:unnamed protein product [Rangifer tarandus platyrhynchus]|uniref:Uncharacterized protein n=1 Tax=Rangifer tarandus platyrhynchus TaxID=3082113 RepID=A0ABN8ZZZ2_RANTA|nr:unnamed protein product [Rangifer tarandus platyrhynchus]